MDRADSNYKCNRLQLQPRASVALRNRVYVRQEFHVAQLYIIPTSRIMLNYKIVNPHNPVSCRTRAHICLTHNRYSAAVHVCVCVCVCRMSASDARRVLRARNTSRAPLLVHAYTAASYGISLSTQYRLCIPYYSLVFSLCAKQLK